MNPFKSAAAKLLTALAIQPALRGSTAPAQQIDVDHDKDVILEEMGVTVYAAHRPEYHAKYTGPVTGWREQSKVMGRRKLANGCFAVREETERFIAARTR